MNKSKQESNAALVLEFCVNLARCMVISGANLERVDLTMTLICRAYGFTDVSIFLLSSHISLSAKDPAGNYFSRQVTILPASIHLERLKRLNRLSYTVVNEKPQASELHAMLDEAWRAREYSEAALTAGQVGAIASLCLIFGGGITEVLITAVLTIALRFVGRLMRRIDLNRLVASALTMTIATLAVMVMYTAGITAKPQVLFITLCMIFLPGIPLVNAVRNLICDHEMNGVLQLMKVVLETAALGAGIYVAVFVFKGGAGLSSQTVTFLSDPWLLIFLSFCASVGFGVVFEIPPHDLWRAGIGGVLTRLVLIFLPGVVHYRLIFTGAAALVAALYAEFLASKRRDPSTYFVYPAIIPLIPGDLFFYAILGTLYGNWTMAMANGGSCIVALLGMSIGFVLSSSVSHYTRKVRNKMRRNRLHASNTD
ncbi:MAG: threonine/serine exporter family protein [Mogibacterium sp.]|nr:threonine/serine exporter family protein [Mogibacterium sp.]